MENLSGNKRLLNNGALSSPLRPKHWHNIKTCEAFKLKIVNDFTLYQCCCHDNSFAADAV